MPVLSIWDYNYYFAYTCKYGKPEDKWPRETILVYKCEWDIECEEHFNKGQIPWSVIRNEEECHVEECLLNSLKEKLKTYHSFRYENFQNDVDGFKKNLHMKNNFVKPELKPVGYFSLRIYLSYSPCGKCADRLIAFKKEFHRELDVEISISFSNFYMHKERSNWAGLLKLRYYFRVAEGEAENFTILKGEERWEKFFQEMEVKGTETLSKWREIATKRRERETEDDVLKLDEAIKKPVPIGRCLAFFNYKDDIRCRYSHECLWCEDSHEIARLCNTFFEFLALKQEGQGDTDALP